MDRSRENNAEDSATSDSRDVSGAAAAAAERIGESVEQYRAALSEVQTVVADRTRECIRTTDTYVRENPWQAVGIAAGVGILVGLLIRGR